MSVYFFTRQSYFCSEMLTDVTEHNPQQDVCLQLQYAKRIQFLGGKANAATAWFYSPSRV